jgi:hypothetical protein
MRKRFTIAALAVVAFASITGVANAQVGTGKTTGAGHITAAENPFAPFHLTVNARGIATGLDVVPDGRVTFKNPDISFTGNVTCYFQLGNEVQIAGEVIKSKDLDGGFYALSIVDNGDEDLVSFTAAADVPLSCFQAGPAVLPVTNGNFTVHDVLE